MLGWFQSCKKDRGDHLGQDGKMVWPRGYREFDQHRRQRCGPAAHCTAGPKGEVNGKDSILLHCRHCTWTCRCREAHDSMARIVPDNPSAFPPSMEVRWRRYDCRDAGVRATPGAVAENRVGNSGRGRARAAIHGGRCTCYPLRARH